MHPDMCGDKFLVPPFKAFPKIPRFARETIITEKIDGTNASIYVPQDADEPLIAGSRNKWLIGCDNFGFAAWVEANRAELRTLGPGTHYGEWFGAGIQRGYGLQDKRFALFNVRRWFDPKVLHLPAVLPDAAPCPACCTVVPVLRVSSEFRTIDVEDAVGDLRIKGSKLVPGFMQPEGVVVLHTASGQLFKKTLEHDEKPKGAKP